MDKMEMKIIRRYWSAARAKESDIKPQKWNYKTAVPCSLKVKYA